MSNKRHKRKSRKLLLITSGVISLLLIAVLIIFGTDYKKYNDFQESNFFGSKDVYSQDQSLFFDNLKVTVTEVEHKAYDYQTIAGCMKLSEKAGALIRANNFVKTPEWETLSFQSGHCMDLADLYENKKILIVHYFLENTSDSPLDLSSYTIKIYGDEKTESTKSENKIISLLAGQSRYDSFVVHHLDKDKNGPFALIVTKDGKQKQIQLELPKLAPFCDASQCNKQVYDRTFNPEDYRL